MSVQQTPANAQAGPSTAQPNGNIANGSVNDTAAQPNGVSPPVNGTSGVAAANAEEAQMPDMNQLYQARGDEEASRRDKSLAEFLVMLDGYKPLVSCLCETTVG